MRASEKWRHFILFVIWFISQQKPPDYSKKKIAPKKKKNFKKMAKNLKWTSWVMKLKQRNYLHMFTLSPLIFFHIFEGISRKLGDRGLLLIFSGQIFFWRFFSFFFLFSFFFNDFNNWLLNSFIWVSSFSNLIIICLVKYVLNALLGGWYNLHMSWNP